MNNEDLQQLKALAEAASPGPWSGDRYDGTVKYEVLDVNGATVIRGDNSNMSEGGYGIENEEDERFILAANPDTVLHLIARIESLAADAERKDKALKASRAALKTAEYAISGREHTGFIDTTVAIIDAAIAKEKA
jgi:hypothetical protein